ncbi:hypothetical protein ES703_50995 [subsurface metagenome]
MKSSNQTQASYFMWAKTGYIFTIILDPSLCYWVIPSDKVKNGCLSGTIGANNSPYLAFLNIKIHVVYSNQATETLSYLPQFKQSHILFPPYLEDNAISSIVRLSAVSSQA